MIDMSISKSGCSHVFSEMSMYNNQQVAGRHILTSVTTSRKKESVLEH